MYGNREDRWTGRPADGLIDGPTDGEMAVTQMSKVCTRGRHVDLLTGFRTYVVTSVKDKVINKWGIVWILI